MSEAAVACRDCGERARLVHSGLRDRHFGVEGSWRILFCVPCDRFWLDPVPDPAALESSYDEYYTHGSAPPAGFEPWLKRAIPAARLGYDEHVSSRDRVAARLLSAVGPLRTIGERAVLWLPPHDGGQLLDVGCGSGDLLARMGALGWTVAGVEFDAAAAKVARQRSGAKVYRSLDDVKSRQYDAVVLDHVFEHLADAPAMLAQCLHALRPGGQLALATPNPTSAARNRFGASWLHWDPPRHVGLYGEAGLRRVVEAAGFEIDRLFSCAGSAHFVWSASREIEETGALPGIRLTRSLFAERGASLRFWLNEHRRVAAGDACGEEWIVLAKRPAQTTEDASE